MVRPRPEQLPQRVFIRRIGKALADSHLTYEAATPYPLTETWAKGRPADWHVEKMKFNNDKSALTVNPSLTLGDFPAAAFGYTLGGRSALDWVIEQYQVKTDKRSGIMSDPNRYSDDEKYIVDLVRRVTTVSVETVRLGGSCRRWHKDRIITLYSYSWPRMARLSYHDTDSSISQLKDEPPMQLGMIGLGKMGANMTTRLIRGGHTVVAFDHNPEAIAKAAVGGATPAASLAEVVSQLAAPRTVWVMVPSGDPTVSTVHALADLLQSGDTIIDGGNSFYGSSVTLGQEMAAKGIQFVDVGTSGGVWGLDNGYSLMIGGDADTVTRLAPIFQTLAPSPITGWGRVGPSGAGHYSKMIHNGIEYGMMQAFAEGLSILRAKKEFEFDLSEVTRIWQDGSVVRSWLLDLIQGSLENDEKLEDIAAYVPDSGEGRWTVFESINLNVSAPVITASLERRIRSREDGYTDKLISIMRNAFGGHAVKKAGE